MVERSFLQKVEVSGENGFAEVWVWVA